jgi:hypothetical protein
MGHASNRKGEQGGSHRADGRQAGCTEGAYRPLDGGRCRLPIASGVESEETAESIHFAPPLTWASAMAQSYGCFRSTSNAFWECRYSRHA